MNAAPRPRLEHMRTVFSPRLSVIRNIYARQRVYGNKPHTFRLMVIFLTDVFFCSVVYNAMGLAAYELFDNVDFDQWFKNQLLGELQVNHYRYSHTVRQQQMLNSRPLS